MWKTGKNVCGGDVEMWNGYLWGYPGYIPADMRKEREEADFLKLPEETQEALLRSGVDSEDELRRRLSELSLKE